MSTLFDHLQFQMPLEILPSEYAGSEVILISTLVPASELITFYNGNIIRPQAIEYNDQDEDENIVNGAKDGDNSDSEDGDDSISVVMYETDEETEDEAEQLRLAAVFTDDEDN